MSLHVERFINELMTSNCYLVVDEESKRCVCIDPASEKSEREIAYIKHNGLSLDYIILTHEHTDHTWGVNSLKDKYPDARITCSELCDKYAKKASKVYFLFYYDRADYKYIIYPADVKIKTEQDAIEWAGHYFHFLFTPGHSFGSVCINLDGLLFTGDTIMPFKPYFNGRDSNEADWKDSIRKVLEVYPTETIIYPGHGEVITLGSWLKEYHL